MQKKTKLVILAAFSACVIGLGRFADVSSLKSRLLSYGSSISEGAFAAVVPAAFYDGGPAAFSGSRVINALEGLVNDTIFPTDPWMGDVENQALAEFNEYYPSQEELDAFALENANAAGNTDPGGGNFDGGTNAGGSADGPDVGGGSEPGGTDGSQPTAVADNAPATTGSGSVNEATGSAQGADNDIIPAVATPANGILYDKQSLYDYTFLINNFYITDSSTSSDASLIDGETLLNRDLTMDLRGDDPKILIYHTHSQESFSDSRPGEISDTVVGLGNTLTDILQEKYHIQVYHDTGVYDMVDGVEDRNEAYSLAQAAVSQILEQNPSIKVVIDLHRDGVAEGTHLVTEINGKPTAKIMFFNGLCRSADNDTNGYLQNPYLTDNLAFSLQMQIKAAEKYPDFTRRIYLRDYRYNLHMCPRSLLVECGAQTNTVEEVQNAMEPLADLLYCVLSGQ